MGKGSRRKNGDDICRGGTWLMRCFRNRKDGIGPRSLSTLEYPQLYEVFLYCLALRAAEAVERLGHEVVADAHAGKRALDALNDAGAVAPDAVDGLMNPHDALVQLGCLS